MINPPLKIVILGLSITSSWGNGHATTYRALVRELHQQGHEVIFLEKDVSWYAQNRDLPNPGFCKLSLYQTFEELQATYSDLVKMADLVMVGSYVPDGVAVGEFVTQHAGGVTAFYDIDTPVTLAKMERGDFEYLHPHLVQQYNMYLSFTGGPALQQLENVYGSRMARAFYCSVDPTLYYPEASEANWDLGYLGTYSDDRQPSLEKLMLEAASKLPTLNFVVAGPQYPASISWAKNVERIEHLPPAAHRSFYNQQRFTMNITRQDMIKAGYSPSVRLFEAAACGTPIISDYWDGIDSIFEINREILISSSAEDTHYYLTRINEVERKAIGERARNKVLSFHTAGHRAEELLEFYKEALERKSILVTR